ncbi:NAD(P)/FAD-dependent oxidoreductase [bacterium]|nr:NAD(P)/FAD-dependent oxidoreductase [bacterium]
MTAAYDIIVAGAGPGGSWAAKAAAENGMSVLMLEKDREVGIPVRCAEGVSVQGLELAAGSVDARWIAATITGARFVAPNGTVIDAYPDDRGYILHRRIFDSDLAERAVQAGARLQTNAFVCGLLLEGGRVCGVRCRCGGRTLDLKARIVIGADGTESRVGRWAGLDTRLPPALMESCVQKTLTGIDVDPGRVEFHLGTMIAPGGYAWVFPKNAHTANVGLGITGEFAAARKPADYLDHFIETRFPGASVLAAVAGGVPVGPPLSRLTGDGIMLVGDAARQANPLTGGGIVNAMIAGRIAGETAARAVRKGRLTRHALSAYEKEWEKTEGRQCRFSYRIKQVVDAFSDEELNRTAELLAAVPPERRSAFQIFRAALVRHPKLILQAAKIFT